jgi:hypothetical protein
VKRNYSPLLRGRPAVPPLGGATAVDPMLPLPAAGPTGELVSPPT